MKEMIKLMMNIVMIIFGAIFAPIVTMMVYMAGMGIAALPIINGDQEAVSLISMWLSGLICLVITLALSQMMVIRPFKVIMQEIKDVRERQAVYEQLEQSPLTSESLKPDPGSFGLTSVYVPRPKLKKKRKNKRELSNENNKQESILKQESEHDEI